MVEAVEVVVGTPRPTGLLLLMPTHHTKSKLAQAAQEKEVVRDRTGLVLLLRLAKVFLVASADMRLALAALAAPAVAAGAMEEPRDAVVLTEETADRQALVAVADREPQPESSENRMETSMPVAAVVVRLAVALLLVRLALAAALEEILARATRMLIQVAGAVVLTMADITAHPVSLSSAMPENKGGHINEIPCD